MRYSVTPLLLAIACSVLVVGVHTSSAQVNMVATTDGDKVIGSSQMGNPRGSNREDLGSRRWSRSSEGRCSAR